MPFGLQSDLPDRALPDALHAVLVQQTAALEALLHPTFKGLWQRMENFSVTAAVSKA